MPYATYAEPKLARDMGYGSKYGREGESCFGWEVSGLGPKPVTAEYDADANSPVERGTRDPRDEADPRNKNRGGHIWQRKRTIYPERKINIKDNNVEG